MTEPEFGFSFGGTYGGPTPTPQELAQHLGWGSPDAELVAQLQEHIDWAAAVVGLYVGRQHAPTNTVTSPWAPGLRQVILSLAGRSASNPTSAEYLSAGNVQSKPGMPDLTLTERLVLDQYRVTVA